METWFLYDNGLRHERVNNTNLKYLKQKVLVTPRKRKILNRKWKIDKLLKAVIKLVIQL